MKRVNILGDYKPAVLVDGVISAGWVITEKKGAALIEIEPYHKLGKQHLRPLEAEALEFLKFMREDAKSYDVKVQSTL